MNSGCSLEAEEGDLQEGLLGVRRKRISKMTFQCLSNWPMIVLFDVMYLRTEQENTWKVLN